MHTQLGDETFVTAEFADGLFTPHVFLLPLNFDVSFLLPSDSFIYGVIHLRP